MPNNYPLGHVPKYRVLRGQISYLWSLLELNAIILGYLDLLGIVYLLVLPTSLRLEEVLLKLLVVSVSRPQRPREFPQPAPSPEHLPKQGLIVCLEIT